MPAHEDDASKVDSFEALSREYPADAAEYLDPAEGQLPIPKWIWAVGIGLMIFGAWTLAFNAT